MMDYERLTERLVRFEGRKCVSSNVEVEAADAINTLRRERDEARAQSTAAEHIILCRAETISFLENERDAAVARWHELHTGLHQCCDRAEKAERERDEALGRYGECVAEKTEERRNYVFAANERDAALALLREAVEALEPFAEAATSLNYKGPEWLDHEIHWFRSAFVQMPTVGDLRRARTVLEKIKIEIDNANRQKKD